MISWLSDRRSLSVLNHFLSTQFFRDQLHRVLKNPKMCYMDKVLMIVMGRNSSSQSIFLYITFKITTCVLLSHQKLLFLLKADEWSLLSRNFFCTRSVLEKFDSLLIYILASISSFYLINYAYDRFDFLQNIKNRLSEFSWMINIEEFDAQVCHSNFEIIIRTSHYSVSIMIYFEI